jgi:hypothetical protein
MKKTSNPVIKHEERIYTLLGNLLDQIRPVKTHEFPDEFKYWPVYFKHISTMLDQLSLWINARLHDVEWVVETDYLAPDLEEMEMLDVILEDPYKFQVSDDEIRPNYRSFDQWGEILAEHGLIPSYENVSFTPETNPQSTMIERERYLDDWWESGSWSHAASPSKSKGASAAPSKPYKPPEPSIMPPEGHSAVEHVVY